MIVVNLAKRLKRILGAIPWAGMLAVTGVANIILALLGLISGVLAARLLGPDGRGQLSAILTWPTFLANIAVVGLSDALLFSSAGAPQRSGKLLVTTVLLALASCLIIGPLGYSLLPWFIRAQSTATINAARNYLLLLLPVWAIVSLLPHPLRARKDMIYWNIVRVLPPLVWIISILMGAKNTPVSAVNISSLYVLGLAGLIVPIGFVISKRIPAPFWPDWTLAKPILNYGVPAIAANLPSALNLRLDQMLMAAFVDQRLLGFYAVSVAWGSITLPVTNALIATLLPRIVGASDNTHRIHLLTQGTRLGTLLSIFLVLISILLAPFGVPLLFGESFREIVHLAIGLSVATGILTINQVLETGIMSIGKPKLIIVAEGIGFVITVVSLPSLFFTFGLPGAVVASIFSYTTVQICLVSLLCVHTGSSVPDIIGLKISDLNSIYSRIVTIE